MTLEAAVKQLPADWLNDYPLFDEGHRETLNRRILDRYWLQEIGQETASVFHHLMGVKMREIMPYYNQLYASEKLKFDPLQTVNIKNLTTSETTSTGSGTNTTEMESEGTGESTTDSTSDAKSRAVASEFPQTQLSGNGDYATSAQDNISDTHAHGTSSEASTGKQTGTGTETNQGHQDGTVNGEVSGFTGNYSLLLAQYRATFMNIDLMVVEDLQSLFMLVISTGDEFTERGFEHGFPAYWN